MQYQRVGLVSLILICVILVSVISLKAYGAEQRLPGERYLHDFKNDDGSVPDGSDADRDDTSALCKALAMGPGTVRIGRGYYRCGDVSIPAGVTLAGLGKGTVIRGNGKADHIFRVTESSEWELRDVVLDGESEGDWRKREDNGKVGLSTSGCWGFEISGVTARNFSGTGFLFSHTNLAKAAFSDGGRVDRLVAYGNQTGIRFDKRGEYITATHLNCRENVIGCAIHAGNTNVSASNFCGNVDGMLITDKENGSHGAIVNCLFNHNSRYALYARDVENGMSISNGCFFYGTILLENSTGVLLTSSLVSCHVKTAGESANRFAGNHIIPKGGWTFEFSEATIVKDNFTKSGPWDFNR